MRSDGAPSPPNLPAASVPDGMQVQFAMPSGTAGEGDPDSLQEFARRALEGFALADARLTRLPESDNVVYRADAPSGDRFALRLHTATRHTPRALASEMAWLDHLHRTTHLPVPRPLRDPAGSWLMIVGSIEGRPLAATVLAWLDGDPLAERPDAHQAAQTGTLLARLHLQAKRFAPPADFERPRYDLLHFRRCWQDLRSTLGPARLAAKHEDGIAAGLARCATLLGPIEGAIGGFGILHADAHPDNLLLHEGEVRLIDFDRCGWGAYLFDIAESSLDLEPPERDALLEGYLRYRDLPTGFEAHLRAWTSLGALENLAYLAKRPNEFPFVLEMLPTVADAFTRIDA